MDEKSTAAGTEKQRIVVVVGPTASGKSALAVDIAKRFDGEVMSADSRQVYRGLDIGTGKVTKEEMAGIPHHLLDIADPIDVYTVVDFVRDGVRTIEDVCRRGKLPIVVGGTFFYIDSLLNISPLPDVPPNPELRTKLEHMDEQTLFGALLRLDPRRAEEIDRKNKRRLIRALEIIAAVGRVPDQRFEPRYDTLIIGISVDKKELRDAIRTRLHARMVLGMVEEAKRLHSLGLSFERMDELGLEYRHLARLLRGDIDEARMLEELEIDIRHYAKRQMTWLKRNKDIVWVEKGDYEAAVKLVDTFLNRI